MRLIYMRLVYISHIYKSHIIYLAGRPSRPFLVVCRN